jgi:hypothetical protein
MLRFARDVVYCSINDLDESITEKILEENGLFLKGDIVYIKAGTKFEVPNEQMFGAPAIIINGELVLSFTTDTPIEVYID